MTVVIRPGEASLADWRAVLNGAPVAVDPSCGARVAASAATVERILARGEPVYGVNTGFGKLASVRIAAEDLAQLQRNIVLSHAAGVGEPAPVATTRLMMALKLGSLAQGASGVQPGTLEFIEAMLARGVDSGHPVARIGRRVRRSRAARPYGRGDDRRGRSAHRRSRHAR